MTSVGKHLNETITIMRLVKIQVWPFGDSTQGINFGTAPVALFCLLQITPRGDIGIPVTQTLRMTLSGDSHDS